ncbi:hypothetical protein BC835DRAFT_1413371 [Cytidiella melzeri]|nr:hypothetical protein BC835DRAFT_1413371 [Cytidiella melzeri]
MFFATQSFQETGSLRVSPTPPRSSHTRTFERLRHELATDPYGGQFCEEAQETVIQSKRVWEDTPFSVFAVQSFQPPHNKTGMQALLEHSRQNYGPIPSELCPHRVRSRTSSRPTLYPIRQHFSVSPEQHTAGQSFSFHDESSASSMGLREISINPNITILSSPPTLEVNPFLPFAVEMETSKPDKTYDRRYGALTSAHGHSTPAANLHGKSMNPRIQFAMQLRGSDSTPSLVVYTARPSSRFPPSHLQAFLMLLQVDKGAKIFLLYTTHDQTAATKYPSQALGPALTSQTAKTEFRLGDWM